MRDDGKPHPGQWRIMQVDSGAAGIIVAAGFVLLGLVVAPVLIVRALLIGVAVAFLALYGQEPMTAKPSFLRQSMR